MSLWVLYTRWLDNIFKCATFDVYLSSVPAVLHLLQVHVGGDDYLHIRVHEKLPCHGGGIEVHGVQESKNHADPVVYF